MIEPRVYHSLGLSEFEYKKILKILGREPTLTELAMFSVEWSEHCGYPSSRKLIRLFPKKGKFKTVIGEDAGGIIIDDLAIIFKMESHNHPSQVEPKQGAATGVGGIIRDIFTTGARPIALLDSLRFGNLNKDYSRYIFMGVVDGIQFYGNCVGVPTVGGEVYFDESYNGNCLVNVMCVGIAKKNKLIKAQAKGEGNSIVYVGSSTGRDGIGGCSVLASSEFKEGEEKRPTVQIGDPFIEKCLIEAVLEAVETGYIIGMKDMGAAGLTCCSSEMSAKGGFGMEIELSLVPKREPNMQPWEIMLSESQERMLLCVKKGKEKKIQEIFKKWGLNAVVIGKVNKSKFVTIKNNSEVVAKINSTHLVNPPLYNLSSKKPSYIEKLKKIPKLPKPKDYNEVLLRLLSSPSIADKSWIYEQYDHMVQTNTVLLPGSDAAIIRIKESCKGIALTTDCNSRYCFLDPYRGAQIALAEAARNLVCVGAEPAAITDCLNFGNPKDPEKFWQFKKCIEGIVKACKVFKLAVVSGNVSFYNESPLGAIKPTPTIGMLGVIKDIKHICSANFKKFGDYVILLGENKKEIGASEYLKEIYGLERGEVPKLSLKLELALQKTILKLIERDLINSAHDCSEGGLAVALAESCILNSENLVGVIIDNLNSNLSEDVLLFGETQSRVIISCDSKNLKEVEKIIKKNKLPYSIIGKTIPKIFKIIHRRKEIINLELENLLRVWKSGLTKYLEIKKPDN